MNKLIRTDSTQISYVHYKKRPASIITPLGRIRRIERLNKELIVAYKTYLQKIK